MPFVSRDYDLNEHDDWEQNVKPHVNTNNKFEGHIVDGHVVGWLLITGSR